METTRSSVETSQASEASQRDSVGEIAYDIQALFKRVSLHHMIAIGTEKLSRDGFDASACTTVEAASRHLMEIFAVAGRRQGKIRQVLMRASTIRQ